MTGACRPTEDRFWAKVEKREDGCWGWLGGLSSSGYARLKRGGKNGGNVPAHRFAYELLVGPIGDGLQLDHLCRNRWCVNPHHVEPVTARENMMRSPVAPPAINARKTHCKHGHEFTEANTRMREPGWRACRACHRRRDLERYHRLRNAS